MFLGLAVPYFSSNYMNIRTLPSSNPKFKMCKVLACGLLIVSGQVVMVTSVMVTSAMLYLCNCNYWKKTTIFFDYFCVYD